MYHIALSAVRRRSGPASLVAVLAARLAPAASCAGWYGLTVESRSADHTVAGAPVEQRVIGVRQILSPGDDPRGSLDALAATAQGLLPRPGGSPVLGAVAD